MSNNKIAVIDWIIDFSDISIFYYSQINVNNFKRASLPM